MGASPQLTIGVVSAGAVGLAVAEACAAAGHTIHSLYAHSAASAQRAAQRLPDAPQRSMEETVHAALVLLAVPDPLLPDVVEQVASHTQDGQIVAHVSGAYGCEILQPVTDTGALPLALHPAMTFTGDPEDTQRLAGCGWGVTADSEIGFAVAELFVASIEGIPVRVPEAHRVAYHAGLVHGSNHLVTLVSDALRILDYALAPDAADSPVAGPVPQSRDSATLLRRLAHAALDNALDERMQRITGPASRDDAPAIARHLDALDELEPRGVDPRTYHRMAEKTAQVTGAFNVERILDIHRFR